MSEVLPKRIKNPIYKEFFELEGYDMIPHKNIIDNIGRGSILYTRKDLVGKEVEFKIPRIKEKFEEGIFYELNLKVMINCYVHVFIEEEKVMIKTMNSF